MSYPRRRFRPLQESVDIVEKMLAVAAYLPTETLIDERGQQITVVDYWERRLHGYLKLADQKGVKVISRFRDGADQA